MKLINKSRSVFLTELEAEIKEAKGSIILSQHSPKSSVILTGCFDAKNDVIKEKVDYVIDVRISAKFDKDGKCQEGGPVFNPFKVRKNTPAI